MSNTTINYKAKTTKELVIVMIGKVNHVCDDVLPSIDRHLKAQNTSIEKHGIRLGDIERADTIAEAIKTSRKDDEDKTKQDRRFSDEKRYRNMKLALIAMGTILLPTIGWIIHEVITNGF